MDRAWLRMLMGVVNDHPIVVHRVLPRPSLRPVVISGVVAVVVGTLTCLRVLFVGLLGRFGWLAATNGTARLAQRVVGLFEVNHEVQ